MDALPPDDDMAPWASWPLVALWVGLKLAPVPLMLLPIGAITMMVGLVLDAFWVVRAGWAMVGYSAWLVIPTYFGALSLLLGVTAVLTTVHEWHNYVLSRKLLQAPAVAVCAPGLVLFGGVAHLCLLAGVLRVAPVPPTAQPPNGGSARGTPRPSPRRGRRNTAPGDASRRPAARARNRGNARGTPRASPRMGAAETLALQR